MLHLPAQSESLWPVGRWLGRHTPLIVVRGAGSPQRTFPQGGPLACSFRCCGLPPRRSESSGSAQDLGRDCGGGHFCTSRLQDHLSPGGSWGMPAAPWPGPKTSVTQSWPPSPLQGAPLHTRHPSPNRKNAFWVWDPKFLEVLPTHSCSSWSRPPSESRPCGSPSTKPNSHPRQWGASCSPAHGWPG